MKAPRLLLVDDEELFSRYLSRFLQKEGFAVQVAANAEQAIQFLEKETFSACIVDLALPGKSGVDLMRQIRGDARWRKLPLIVQSGFSDRLLKEVMSLEPVRLFQKPYPLPELASTLREALGIGTETP